MVTLCSCIQPSDNPAVCPKPAKTVMYSQVFRAAIGIAGFKLKGGLGIKADLSMY